nr:hypothetical protein [uncultured Celeribacter sp.]
MTDHRKSDFSAQLTRNDALEKLAERLYEKIEALDPSDAPSWASLPKDHPCRRLYRLAVSDLVLFVPWIAAAQAGGALDEYGESSG